MKQSHKFAVGIAASLGLGIAVAAAYANPGQMGGGMGPQMKGGMQHGAQAGMQHGAQGGAQHGMKGGTGHGGMGGGAAGHGAGAQLMTPEERTALQEKMRNAKTPEERQQIADATRTEMQKRAQEKGITLPEHRGPHFGTTPQAPGTTQ
ncbi:MAG: hypothetical protein A3I02_11030 [Betaproteobacteria bacterium RIFCSPLOWO2_02_FULL_67_26]|nr:MAG: hypothetical protein A3I02_11030 [Betaproteobacteria bacterium RIFCSPLOWO2_02_FULL_67_26]